MASSQSHSVKALVAYRNLMYHELIRTVHVYRSEEGEEKQVEREYVFHHDREYEEIGFCDVFTLQTFRVSAQSEGLRNGVWLCIYVFDAERHSIPDLNRIPTILHISRNPKLESIPTLANDLRMISQSGCRVENREPTETLTDETSLKNSRKEHQQRTQQSSFLLDLNSLPYPDSDNEIDQSASGDEDKKKKRATTKDIARLALEDLAKYFDLPIVEASKNLKVGLTVLKKKCREFGIPRWPHRKIKSLDSLIRDLQEEVERQEEGDEGAVVAVAKRQRMIESEKENIERKPFMEIHRETKKFRQDIFKRRHKARLLENQRPTLAFF